MASGFGAGGLIVPLVVLLIDACGWRLTLVILGAGMWLLSIPLSLIVRNRPEQVEFNPEAPVAESSKASPEGERFPRTKGAFLDMIKKRSFLYLNLAETVADDVRHRCGHPT